MGRNFTYKGQTAKYIARHKYTPERAERMEKSIWVWVVLTLVVALGTAISF